MPVAGHLADQPLVSDLSKRRNTGPGTPALGFGASNQVAGEDTATGNITITYPGNTRAGHFVVMVAQSRDARFTTTPSGWTFFKRYAINSTSITSITEGDTWDLNTNVWTRVADGTEPATFDLSLTNNGADCSYVVHIMTFGGVNSINQDQATGGFTDPPWINAMTTQPDDIYLAINGHSPWVGSFTTTPPTGFTQIQKGTAEPGCKLLTAYQIQTGSGSTGQIRFNNYGNTYDIAWGMLLRQT